MNCHDSGQTSRKELLVLGGLEASLLTCWKNVLHVASHKEGKAKTEDQRLTSVLGMAIGHTRRLRARFTKEATKALNTEPG